MATDGCLYESNHYSDLVLIAAALMAVWMAAWKATWKAAWSTLSSYQYLLNPILLSISSQSYPPIMFFSILSSYQILLNPIPLDAPTHAIPSQFCHFPTTIWNSNSEQNAHVRLNYVKLVCLMENSCETDLNSKCWAKCSCESYICEMGLLNGNIMSNWSETPMCEQNAHVRLMWNWSA